MGGPDPVAPGRLGRQGSGTERGRTTARSGYRRCMRWKLEAPEPQPHPLWIPEGPRLGRDVPKSRVSDGLLISVSGRLVPTASTGTVVLWGIDDGVSRRDFVTEPGPPALVETLPAVAGLSLGFAQQDAPGLLEILVDTSEGPVRLARDEEIEIVLGGKRSATVGFRGLSDAGYFVRTPLVLAVAPDRGDCWIAPATPAPTGQRQLDPFKLPMGRLAACRRRVGLRSRSQEDGCRTGVAGA